MNDRAFDDEVVRNIVWMHFPDAYIEITSEFIDGINHVVAFVDADEFRNEGAKEKCTLELFNKAPATIDLRVQFAVKK